MTSNLMDVKSEAAFDAAIAGKTEVAVHFWATWCEPCKPMDAVFAELAKAHPTGTFLRVEAEAVDTISMRYEVSAVPFFVVLGAGGAVVDRVEGADAAALTAAVSKHMKKGAAAAAKPAATSAKPAATSASGPADVEGRIKSLLASAPVLLFMKGNKETARCGFSRKVVDALQSDGVDFQTFDILEDEDVRQGLKTYSNWPTYPQLYVNGELIGGCDIILEMKEDGSLGETIKEQLATSKPETESLEDRIRKIIASDDVMLFMKGGPGAERCGFSRKVVEALQGTGIPFGTFDILGDEDVRQGLKTYSNWPTYPQLYVKSELVGGCDIILEMAAGGELGSTIQEMMGGAEPEPEDLNTRLEKLTKKHDVMLFMKGEPMQPRCGFSGKVVNMLIANNVKFGTFDILSDEEVRQGLKTFSNWPTFPQLYVKGDLIGGCDIITELDGAGELGSTIREALGTA